ncbi:tripartite tricarboxylate transporter substrate binding protein [Burkholderiaceae bacterium FT117]|uniref:Bug family tripartite tricarboxylate transporter substrate binding protein n=1 Tax=Zeimonas sediminis TaxID=2944268 RepID=UPI002342FEBE|nr:tripartite tricarboxylate transporter substrate binding protein [Zeimonas sediminis]MCM5571761.1 tripartite tricarboxylate transporter substrate binding protein [Zeimonas sediminis]
MKALRTLAVMLVCLAANVAAAPPDYPSRPIQVVVPYGPGGAVDVIGRVFAEHMSQTLGQPIVIQNRPGANANIGPSLVAKASPDGYTLLASSTATVFNPLTERNIDWSASSFTPIARMVQSPNLIVVSPAMKVNTLQDFIVLARSKPGLTTPVTGLGSSQSVARESFAKAAGIELLGVAYKGGVSFIPDLLSGTLAMSVSPMNVVLRLVKDGQLVAIGNTGPQRSPLLPDVPTMSESGFPEATSVSWFGFHAPAGTPKPVIQKLARAVSEAAADPRIQARIAALGAELAYLDTPAFQAFLDDEVARATKFIEAMGKSKR